MSTEDSVFPQAGDPKEAERFAQLAGQSIASNYVEIGVDLNVDFGNNTVDVSEGLCYIRVDEREGSATGDGLLSLGYAVQVESRTLDLGSGEQYVVVDPNLGSSSSPLVDVYGSIASAPDDALPVGRIDTDEDVVEELNRSPSVTVEDLEIDGELSSEEIESIESDVGDIESELDSHDHEGDELNPESVTIGETLVVPVLSEDPAEPEDGQAWIVE